VCVGFLCLIPSVWAQVQMQPGAAQACPNPGFDPRPWLEDFHQLLAEMSAHYSNLEYAVQDRHMDLPQLRREAEAKLNASCDEQEARRLFESFLNSFGDGHLEIDWPKPKASDAKPAETNSLCTRLGYEKKTLKPGVDFAQLPQFASLGGDGAEWFPGGILMLNQDEKVGVIRVAIFSEHWFPETCEQAVHELHLTNSQQCDEECENKIEYAAANRLTAALAKRASELQSAGAAVILIDITQNGGGSDWIEPAVRTLSNVPLHESAFGFIKHEHWTKQLQDQLADVETDLKNEKEPKDLLQQAGARLRSGIERSQEKCDRRNVWTDGKLTCSLVVSGLSYVSGVLPYAEAGSFAGLKSKGVLFHPLDYTYTESPSRPRLYVVVDSQTWSSAEYFATILQDNGAATILGEVTGGAGCGFTNGGIPTTLKNSHAQVKMPDCVRFRKDGSNENAGVTPDILVPWSRHDNSYLKAEKLYRSLSAVITPGSKEASHEAH